MVPGHVIFLYTIHLMKSGHTTLTPIFMSVYLATALLQVSFSWPLPLPVGRPPYLCVVHRRLES